MSSPEKTSRLPALGLFVFLGLKPIYLWNSGLPQVADLVLAGTLFLTVVNAIRLRRVVLVAHPAAKIVLVFAYYVAIVNLVAMLFADPEARFLFSALFVAYNAVVLIWMLQFAQVDVRAMAVAVTYGTLVGLSSQLLVVALSGELGGGRAAGSFNNPNQLGYYAVLCASILIAAQRVYGTKVLYSALGISVSAVLVSASLSKAAIGSLAILVIGAALFGVGNRTSGHRWLRLCSAGAVFAAVFVAPRLAWIRESVLVEGVISRFAANESDDGLSARGYDRLLGYPEYWIFGAGEGDFERFGSGIEFHSLPGNLVVSYGVVGFLIFATLVVSTFRASGYTSVYIMFAMMFYGVTHNGLRNTLLWILIALLSIAIVRGGDKNAPIDELSLG